MARIKTLFVVTLLFFLSVPLSSFAQNGNPTNFLFEDAPLQCGDYYRYGSITAFTTFLAESAVSGLPAQFETVLTNTNQVPVTDVSIVVRIYTNNEAGGTETTLDYRVLAEDQTFAAGESKTFDFSWQVPNLAPSGEYLASVYVVSNGQYNWLGMPFSDNVPGSTVSVPVVGESASFPILLTTGGVTVNDIRYPAEEMPMKVSANETHTINAIVENTLDVEVVVPLEWHQYAWSAEADNALKNSATELLVLAPNEKREVSYTTAVQSEAIMFVTAKIQAGELVNQIGVQLIQENLDQLRTRYLGVSQFPLQAGESVTAIACAQNIQRTTIDMANVVITLKDINDVVIRTIDYFGPATGVVRGYGEAFVPEQNYNYVKIESTLLRNGVVDEVSTVVYDCTVIDPESCIEDAVVSETEPSAQPMNPILIFGGFIILVLLMMITLYFFRHKGVPPQPPTTPPSSSSNSSVTLGVVLFALLCIGIPATSSAQCVTPPVTSWDCYASDLVEGPYAPSSEYACVPDGGSYGACFTVWGSYYQYEYQTHNNVSSLPSGYSACVNYCAPPPPPPPPPSNNPPATPTISGPSTGQATTNYSFDVRSTDPDNNTLRYGIDVNNDSLVDAWLPSSGYTNSGTQLAYSRQWVTAGTYSIRAIAEDSNGARSAWATHTIVVSAPPPPASGTFSANPTTVTVGSPVTFSWTCLSRINGSDTNWFELSNLDTGTRYTQTSGSNPTTYTHIFNTAGTYTVNGECIAGNASVTPPGGVIETLLTGTVVITVNPLVQPPVGSCVLGPEYVVEGGPTDLWGGSSCLPVNDLAPYLSPDCPVGATTGTVVNTSSIISAGFCATRQVQTSACSGNAYIRSCVGSPTPPATPNQPPSAPTIAGPTAGTPNTTHSFTVTASDSNNDQIRYGIDWDFNGVIDAWLPGTGYVNSGTLQGTTRTWSADGTYSFRVLTQDALGAASGWATHTIVISTATACSWEYSSATDDFAAAPSNANMTCPTRASAYCNASITSALDGQPASPGAPGLCLLSCSVSGFNRNTETMTKVGPGCGVVGASCSDPAILFTPTTNGENAANRQSCRDLGYTRIIEAGVEDAQLGGGINLPNGTCGVFFADPNGAIRYTYIVLGLDACIPPGPIGSPTLGGTSCEIPAGQNSCTGTVTWDFPTAANPEIRNDTYSLTYGSGLSGNGNPVSLRFSSLTQGLNRIVGYDLGGPTTPAGLIDFIDLYTQCENGSFWNGSSCERPTDGGNSCFTLEVVNATGDACGARGDYVPFLNACTEGCGGSGGCGQYDDQDIFVCFLPMTPTEFPNLTSILLPTDISPSVSGNNTVAGTYSTLRITSIIRNIGNGSTAVAVPYSLLLTNQNTSASTPHSSQVGVMAPNTNESAAYNFTNVPFGIYTIRVEADPAPDDVVESDETDNWAERVDYVLPPPDPGIQLGVSPGTVVREGTTITLNWVVNVSYDMTCTLIGPSLTAPVSFNPRVSGTGTMTAGPITATSDYTLSCTEPITNTTFTDITRVETVGTVEEI